MTDIEASNFYETDFTTVTPWENFTFSLEEMFSNWKNRNIFISDTNKRRFDERQKYDVFSSPYEVAELTKVEFRGQYYRLSETRDDGEQATGLKRTFSGCPHGRLVSMIARLFGLRELVLLYQLTQDTNESPSLVDVFSATSNVSFTFDDESAAPHNDEFHAEFFSNDETYVKMILGAVIVAIDNSRCDVPPVFIKVLSHSCRNYFIGTHMDVMNRTRADYQMLHLKNSASKYQYLPGLIELFRAKMDEPNRYTGGDLFRNDDDKFSTLGKVKARIKFSYVSSDFEQFIYIPFSSSPKVKSKTESTTPRHYDEHGELLIDELGCLETEEVYTNESLLSLPFGTCCDPIEKMYMDTVWPRVMENMCSDSETYTDLEMSNAPVWYCRIACRRANQLLARRLYRYLSVMRHRTARRPTIRELIGNLLRERDTPGARFSPSAIQHPLSQSLFLSMSLDLRSRHRRREPSKGEWHSFNSTVDDLDTSVVDEELTDGDWEDARDEWETEEEEADGGCWSATDTTQTTEQGHTHSYDAKKSSYFLEENVLMNVLYYLFPDADECKTYVYNSDRKKTNNGDDNDEEDADCKPSSNKNEPNSTNNMLSGMKTCQKDDLAWRFSIVICNIIDEYGEQAAAQLWFEFVQELRFRWEKCLLLPGVQKGGPNHKTSLFYQKLQMLNLCIEKRKIREEKEALEAKQSRLTVSKSAEILRCNAVDEKDEDEDCFYDCQSLSSSPDLSKEKFQRSTCHPAILRLQSASAATSFHLAEESRLPDGRLQPLNDFKLLHSGQPVYIPITQEIPPKTEDQLEEDAIVLMKLGSDEEGSKLRAKMMCASLSSDMEAFKAANPGAVLEDFIRWYSPRDWIECSDEVDEYGQKKGRLSKRMLLPGNMWKEVWDASKSLPAHRQKCLFDDVKECEKALHFFESRKYISDVLELLAGTVIHAALDTTISNELVRTVHEQCPTFDARVFSQTLEAAAHKALNAATTFSFSHPANAMLCRSLSTPSATGDMFRLYYSIANDIANIETIAVLYKSLEHKLLPPVEKETIFQPNLISPFGEKLSNSSSNELSFLEELLDHRNSVQVPDAPNGPIARRLQAHFYIPVPASEIEKDSLIGKEHKMSISFSIGTEKASHRREHDMNQYDGNYDGKRKPKPYRKQYTVSFVEDVQKSDRKAVSESNMDPERFISDTGHITSKLVARVSANKPPDIFLATCNRQHLMFV